MSDDQRISPHEFLGVISTRLAHRLSNYISVAAGNLAIHDSPQAKPEERDAALSAVRESMRRAGELLDRFAELARNLRPHENHGTLPELLANISQWAAARPNSSLEVAPQISTWTTYALAGPWKWLVFVLDAITQDASSVALKIEPGARPTGPPLLSEMPVANLALTIQTTGTELLEWHEHREGLKSWSLTAAYELLQYLGARPATLILPNRAQQTKLVLPLLQAVQE